MNAFIGSLFPKQPVHKSNFQNHGVLLFVGFGLLVLVSYLLTKNMNKQSDLTATVFAELKQ